jgi:hypothetical protein
VKGGKQEVSQEHGNLYGVDAVPGNHPKTFHVTLRFESEQEAAAALRMAQATLDPKSGMWQIEFRITAVHRKEAEAEIGPPNPFAQIVYEWK